MSSSINSISDGLSFKISDPDFSKDSVRGHAVISFYSGDRLVHSAKIEATKSKIETTTSFVATGVIAGKEVKTHCEFKAEEEMVGSLRFNPSQIKKEEEVALKKLTRR